MLPVLECKSLYSYSHIRYYEKVHTRTHIHTHTDFTLSLKAKLFKNVHNTLFTIVQTKSPGVL